MVKLPHIKSGRWKAGFLGAVVTCLAAGIVLIGAAGDTGSVSQTNPAKSPTTGLVANNPAEVNLPGGVSNGDSQPVKDSSGAVDSLAQNQPVTGTSHQSTSANQSASADELAPTATNNQVKATLLVNGTVRGTVTLAAGSTQCDLLSQALAEGVISQLTLKYSNQYKNYAVYKINGQGDENSVWWVYKVNDKSPPYGCGSVPVNNNDSVNWEYLRS